MTLFEELTLANGLKLRILDLSRRIADDTVKVQIQFQIKTALLSSFFTDTSDYLEVKKVFGNELTYEHTVERSFVPIENQDIVRAELIAAFKNNSLKYLSAKSFSGKLALSQLRDMKNNPFKYFPRHES